MGLGQGKSALERSEDHETVSAAKHAATRGRGGRSGSWHLNYSPKRRGRQPMTREANETPQPSSRERPTPSQAVCPHWACLPAPVSWPLTKQCKNLPDRTLKSTPPPWAPAVAPSLPLSQSGLASQSREVEWETEVPRPPQGSLPAASTGKAPQKVLAHSQLQSCHVPSRREPFTCSKDSQSPFIFLLSQAPAALCVSQFPQGKARGGAHPSSSRCSKKRS